MNKKQISITEVETGLITTGTISEISNRTSLNPKTISRWIQIGHSNNPKWILTPKSDIDETKTDIPPNTLKLGDEIVIETTIKLKPTQNKFAQSQVEDNTQMKYKPVDDTNKTILPQKPCVICGRNVFHTKIIEGKLHHICFASCNTPPIKHERKEPSKEQMQYLLKYIADNTKLAKSVTKGNLIEA